LDGKPMKKIPEKYELDQDDIEEAITDWLNANHTENGDSFIITLKREVKLVDPPNSARRGGMNDPIEQYYFTAVAEKE
jgi:hypothetical protein